MVSWVSSLHPVPMGFKVVFRRNQRQPLVCLTLSPHLLRRRELSTDKGNGPGSTVTPNHVPTAHSHSATPAPWVPPPPKLPAQGLGPLFPHLLHGWLSLTLHNSVTYAKTPTPLSRGKPSVPQATLPLSTA